MKFQRFSVAIPLFAIASMVSITPGPSADTGDAFATEKNQALELVVRDVLGGSTDEVEILINESPRDLGLTTSLRDVEGPVEWPGDWGWLLVIDDLPGAYWRHPARWVFVNRQATRIIAVMNKDSLPRIEMNGRRIQLEKLLEHVRQARPVPQRELPPAPPRASPTDEFAYENYYAVIIEGDIPSGSSFPEFWLDNVIMYRTLLEYGYQPENIYVLYGYGQDETNFSCPWYLETMVDYPAYKQSARDLFTWMRDGNPSEGIPRVTENDFIYLYTFDHGGSQGGCNTTLCFMDGCMPDTEFASYFNQISYLHRAVVMQQCHSGGFIDNLENETTVMTTAANCYESAWQGDESEQCNGHTMLHGEFNYWLMSALRGRKPLPGEEPVDQDNNGDGKVSFWEVFQYVLAHDDASEHPQFSDPGGLGDILSLQTISGPAVYYDSYVIDDSGPYANHDGILQPGETITIPVTLKNIGTRSVYDVTAKLRSDAQEYIRITDSQADFPDLTNGETTTSLIPHYELSVDPEIPCGPRQMNLDITGLDFEKELEFFLRVGGWNCEPWDCGEPKPPSVGETLRLGIAESGDDLILSWDPVVGASDYRVWMSPVADFSEEIFVGKTADGTTSYTVADAVDLPDSYCYLVRAVNSCNQEGP